MKKLLLKIRPLKNILLVALLGIGWVTASTLYVEARLEDPLFLSRLLERFETWNKTLPEERVYVQADKPFYQPGETIWLSAWVVNTKNLQASEQSDILELEFIGPKGTVEKKYNLVLKKGRAAADVQLADDAPGGIYKIKAYTQYQKNDTTQLLFEKEITVQQVILPRVKADLDFVRKAYGPGEQVKATLKLENNQNKPMGRQELQYQVNVDGVKHAELKGVTDENGSVTLAFQLPQRLSSTDVTVNILTEYDGQVESIMRSVPVVLNKISMRFFPEGGDMISGVNGRVAFSATNEFGKPADVEGYVADERGTKVAVFRSFHQGMGAFNLEPRPGMQYHAVITSPVKLKETFMLPQASEQGYSLHVDQNDAYSVGVVVESTVSGAVALVAQSRQQVYFQTSMNVVAGKNKIHVPASQLPMGVVQITLFDAKGIERAERLVFSNRQKQMKLELKTDKAHYQPREKVTLTLRATDENGLPLPARLGIAVVNDQLLSMADDKSGNLLSKLLLEPELQGKVEEPNFYFDKKEPKAAEALDYLLMTAGWRKFTWTQVLENPAPIVSFAPRKAVIGGHVMDPNTGQPIPGAVVKNLSGDKALASTNEKGEFTIAGYDLSEPLTLKVDKDGKQSGQLAIADYGTNYTVYIYQQQPAMRWDMGNADFDAVAEDAVQLAAPDHIEIKLAAAPVQAFAWNADDKPVRAINRAVLADQKKAVVKKEMADKAPAPKPVEKKVNVQEGEVVKRKALLREDMDMNRVMKKPVIPVPVGSKYYRARVFSAPAYTEPQTNYTRTDFRSTLYWNPNVELDKTGRATLSFYAADDITSYRIVAEGLGVDGSPAHEEALLYTQLPFSISAKVPAVVAQGDEMVLPVLLKNNTGKPFSGSLKMETGPGLKLLSQLTSAYTLLAGESKIIALRYKADQPQDTCNYSIAFSGSGLSDAMSGSLRIEPQGFPTGVSFSGKDQERRYKFRISNPVAGSIKAVFTAYPSVVSDLLKGIEGILREPYGCFEQTSMSSYPNVMIMDYMKSVDRKDEAVLASAEKLLDKGYKRLTTFEAKSKGYEWFGASPGHEALTAYGLQQFNDMKNVYDGVDQEMIDRTAAWLLEKRDGKGGFARSRQALDQFGSASEDVTNAYITYSLAAAGFKDIEKEFSRAYDRAMDTKDAYQVALMANAAYHLNKTDKARKLMEVLKQNQDNDGSFMGSTHSITRSEGSTLRIETTGLAVLALVTEAAEPGKIESAVKFLVGQRSGYGMFGSTQGTILSLKALAAYARFAKRTPEDGSIHIKVNGKIVKTLNYKAGQNEPVTFNELGKFVNDGDQEIDVEYVGVKNPLPYAVSVDYNTTQPDNEEECKLTLKTDLLQSKAKVGESLRLKATVKNKTNDGLASPMVVLGIPAGTSLQSWQLKEMQERKVFDYYEIRDNKLFLYYRQMAPGEVKEINLDLKAETAGTFSAAASCTYLYYNPEFKHWANYGQTIIN